MSYPQDVLTDGEQVVVHNHPHIKALVGRGLLLLLATVLCGWGAAWAGTSDSVDGARTPLQIALTVVWLVVLVLFLLRLISWATTHFVITDRRVMFRKGVLTRSGIDIPVRRINSVQFRHGLIDRMLRTGTLIIESASDDPLEFDDIPRVERVHALLYARLEDTLDGEDEPIAPR
ncbi:PH domain-containing protein [Cellulomonas edaphi]|uniref:PH domain-containing protein n=1 Tax=Cellulomonas edaphi TaxID=3053468 RepID=A0ABT7S466_9CELL|nr:PH domain-containing protein [Cellulomons edaphi]MDM7830391.1 PH domain-containing protein [Cellulomons edaphi]